MGRLYNRPYQTLTRQRLRTHGTPAEARLWMLLRERQLLGRRFRRQHGVGPYILDFYCVSERLAVELDGAVHDAPARAAYDENRTAALGRLGIRVVRFPNQLVFERPEAVLDALAAAFRAGA